MPSTSRAYMKFWRLAAASLVLAPAVAQADITLTPSSHDFGNVEVGQRVGPVRITLANEPDTDSDPILTSMNHGGGTTNGELESESVGTCQIGANLMRGESCVFDVFLTVTDTGQVSKTIEFDFVGWSPSPMTVTFTAMGVPPGTPVDVEPTGVPTMGALGLGMLSLAVGAAGLLRRRRQK